MKKKLLFALAASGSIVFLVGFQASATTYIFEQEIIDPNAPVDVCPNIGGVQTVVPDGMVQDANGNCYTPTPPQPPEPPQPPVTVDLCLNLAGTQTSLPAGYYRTTNGNCYIQPALLVELYGVIKD